MTSSIDHPIVAFYSWKQHPRYYRIGNDFWWTKKNNEIITQSISKSRDVSFIENGSPLNLDAEMKIPQFHLELIFRHCLGLFDWKRRLQKRCYVGGFVFLSFSSKTAATVCGQFLRSRRSCLMFSVNSRRPGDSLLGSAGPRTRTPQEEPISCATTISDIEPFFFSFRVFSCFRFRKKNPGETNEKYLFKGIHPRRRPCDQRKIIEEDDI